LIVLAFKAFLFLLLSQIIHFNNQGVRVCIKFKFFSYLNISNLRRFATMRTSDIYWFFTDILLFIMAGVLQ
jgi:hypothetical protein